ncbi:MAG: YbaN family protein [Acidimicrobiia bacterium]|jgi:uncharacterized membrane protein YbaN (DUF454 family)
MARSPAPARPREVRITTSPLLRAVYLALGFLFLGLGIVGYFVPLLPGTVNLLIAVFFFLRSSERMYRWVMDHRLFGHLIRDYHAGLGIPRRIKVWAIGLIVISFGFTIGVAVERTWLRFLLAATALAVSAFILTRPTRERVVGA